MKLAPIKALRERLQARENTETDAAIDRALLAASSHLESILYTEFSRKIIKDVFFVNWSEFPHRADRAKFYLKQGFADSTQPQELKIAASFDELDAQTAQPTKHYRITKDESGLLTVIGSDSLRPPFFSTSSENTQVDPFQVRGVAMLLNFTYVQLEYTAGFESKRDKTNCFSGKVYKDVPEWLEEACLQIGRELYLTDVDVEEAIVDDATSALGNKRGTQAIITKAENMVNRHIRFHPDAQKAMFSDVGPFP
jgi:hypothetical protein